MFLCSFGSISHPPCHMHLHGCDLDDSADHGRFGTTIMKRRRPNRSLWMLDARFGFAFIT